jgi:hypothetical protein
MFNEHRADAFFKELQLRRVRGFGGLGLSVIRCIGGNRSKTREQENRQQNSTAANKIATGRRFHTKRLLGKGRFSVTPKLRLHDYLGGAFPRNSIDYSTYWQLGNAELCLQAPGL